MEIQNKKKRVPQSRLVCRIRESPNPQEYIPSNFEEFFPPEEFKEGIKEAKEQLSLPDHQGGWLTGTAEYNDLFRPGFKVYFCTLLTRKVRELSSMKDIKKDKEVLYYLNDFLIKDVQKTEEKSKAKKFKNLQKQKKKILFDCEADLDEVEEEEEAAKEEETLLDFLELKIRKLRSKLPKKERNHLAEDGYDSSTSTLPEDIDFKLVITEEIESFSKEKQSQIKRKIAKKRTQINQFVKDLETMCISVIKTILKEEGGEESFTSQWKETKYLEIMGEKFLPEKRSFEFSELLIILDESKNLIRIDTESVREIYYPAHAKQISWDLLFKELKVEQTLKEKIIKAGGFKKFYETFLLKFARYLLREEDRREIQVNKINKLITGFKKRKSSRLDNLQSWLAKQKSNLLKLEEMIDVKWKLLCLEEQAIKLIHDQCEADFSTTQERMELILHQNQIWREINPIIAKKIDPTLLKRPIIVNCEDDAIFEHQKQNYVSPVILFQGATKSLGIDDSLFSLEQLKKDHAKQIINVLQQTRYEWDGEDVELATFVTEIQKIEQSKGLRQKAKAQSLLEKVEKVLGSSVYREACKDFIKRKENCLKKKEEGQGTSQKEEEQKQEKNRNKSNPTILFPTPTSTIRFGVNIDFDEEYNWKKKTEHLREKISPYLMCGSSKDALSLLLDLIILGINRIQGYIKSAGSRTGGHQENLRVCAVNIAHGPSGSYWKTFSGKHAEKYRQFKSLLERLEIYTKETLWKLDIDLCLAIGIEVQYFYQASGDMVILQPGCMHSVTSDGVGFNSAWNILPIRKDQFLEAKLRHEINRSLGFKSIIPIFSVAYLLLGKEGLTQGDIDLELIRILADCIIYFADYEAQQLFFLTLNPQIAALVQDPRKCSKDELTIYQCQSRIGRTTSGCYAELFNWFVICKKCENIPVCLECCSQQHLNHDLEFRYKYFTASAYKDTISKDLLLLKTTQCYNVRQLIKRTIPINEKLLPTTYDCEQQKQIKDEYEQIVELTGQKRNIFDFNDNEDEPEKTKLLKTLISIANKRTEELKQGSKIMGAMKNSIGEEKPGENYYSKSKDPVTTSPRNKGTKKSK